MAVELRDLPRGWVWTTIGKIRRDSSTSITPSNFPDEVFELYSIPSSSAGRPEILKGNEIGSAKRLVSEGAVMVSKINPRINRVWSVGNFSSHRKIASPEWIIFDKTSQIDSNYLRYYLSTDAFRDYLAINVSGMGGSLMRVKPALADLHHFPLAPL